MFTDRIHVVTVAVMSDTTDRYVVVHERALLDLLDLSRTAADQIRIREIHSPLADAITGARAQLEADVYVPA